MKILFRILASFLVLFILLSVLSIYKFVQNNQFLLTDEYVQQFLSYLDDNDIVEIIPGRHGFKIRVSDYRGRDLNSFQGPGIRTLGVGGEIYLKKGLSPEEFKKKRESITDSFELDNMLWMHSRRSRRLDTSKVLLLKNFESENYPINHGTIKRALAVNAKFPYVQSQAYYDNHPVGGTLYLIIDGFNMLVRLPVIPLIYKFYSSPGQ